MPQALRETVDRAAQSGHRLETHLCDVTDVDAVARMVDAGVTRFGRVDVLVNVVGGSAKGGPVELAPETWHKQIDYNLGSVYHGCRAVLPHMAAPRRDRQCVVHLRPALDRRGTGGLCVDEGGSDPSLARGLRRVRRVACG
ncbi:MAG: SDR family oxidoreductase [Burkholderiaceae bacterium]